MHHPRAADEKKHHIHALRQEFNVEKHAKKEKVQSPHTKKEVPQILIIEESIEHFLSAIHHMTENLKQEHNSLNMILINYVNRVLNEVQDLSGKIRSKEKSA